MDELYRTVGNEENFKKATRLKIDSLKRKVKKLHCEIGYKAKDIKMIEFILYEYNNGTTYIYKLNSYSPTEYQKLYCTEQRENLKSRVLCLKTRINKLDNYFEKLKLKKLTNDNKAKILGTYYQRCDLITEMRIINDYLVSSLKH